MERIADIDMDELNSLIAAEQASANSEMWGDHDLNERIDQDGFETENPDGILADRRTRPVITYYQSDNGSWQPSRLKQFDHVQLVGAIAVVVAMPARNRQSFLAYRQEYYGASLVTIESSTITDRAPVNEGEEPMPINAPLPVPPAEGDVTITTTIAAHQQAATLTTTINEEGIHTDITPADPSPEGGTS